MPIFADLRQKSVTIARSRERSRKEEQVIGLVHSEMTGLKGDR